MIHVLCSAACLGWRLAFFLYNIYISFPLYKHYMLIMLAISSQNFKNNLHDVLPQVYHSLQCLWNQASLYLSPQVLFSTLNFPVPFFSLNYIFCISCLHVYSFSIFIWIRVFANNLLTYSKLSCIEIYSEIEIISKLFDKILGPRKTEGTLFLPKWLKNIFKHS